MIHVFTDGASRGNPGPGGWGAIIVSQRRDDDRTSNDKYQISNNGSGNVYELGGRKEETTNNEMELAAAVEALAFIAEHAGTNRSVTLYSDSRYVVEGITKWILGWKKRGWKTKQKTPVQHKEMWQKLDTLANTLDVVWQKLPGHSGVVGNVRADAIATAYADGEDPNLFGGKLSSYKYDVLDMSVDMDKKHTRDKKRARSSGKAYSYLSLIDGVAKRHATWAECKQRVEGKQARFRKALSAEHEREVLHEWGVDPNDVR